MILEVSDQTIIMFGAGGHAKSVISVLQAQARWQLAGLLEDGAREMERQVLGYPVLGDQGQLDRLRKAGITKAMVAIGDNTVRGRLADVIVDRGFELVSIIHPTACLMTDCVVEQGAFLHVLSVIGPECRVGRNTIVQPYTSLGHEGRIGDCVQFCPGVHVGGKAMIGDFCFFGPGAVVYPGVKIGCNVEVGANSVINKDVPDHVVVVGNPARVIRRGDASQVIDQPPSISLKGS